MSGWIGFQHENAAGRVHERGSGRPFRRKAMGACLLLLALPLLAACQQQEKAAERPARTVRTVTVEVREAGDTVTLTGHVEAQDEAAVAFRVGGRMLARLVNVGDRVKAGQVLARLDRQNAQNNLRSAEAALSAASATLAQHRNTFERQRHLLDRGFTTRANFDAAQQAHLSAQSAVDDATAQLKIARDNLDYTEIHADADGVITARGAEPGEVVQAGQMIVRIARENGRDAVFDVPAQVLRNAPADPVIRVALSDSPGVAAEGRVREIAPQADPVTRTFAVKVGLSNPPEAFRLGATVVGTMRLDAGAAIELPASALTEFNQQPAVWVVDPATSTVSLRNIEVQRFNPSSVAVASGLDEGEIVVTAGVQVLHDGMKVRLSGAPS
ncbi:efflux RND transporter periplasmic adaptor subunit [Pseudochelatococcus lubricantis]